MADGIEKAAQRRRQIQAAESRKAALESPMIKSVLRDYVPYKQHLISVVVAAVVGFIVGTAFMLLLESGMYGVL